MASNEGLVLVDDFVDTGVGVEVSLDVLKDSDRAVCTTPTVKQVNMQSVKLTKRKTTHPNWPRAVIAGEIPMASWKVRRRDS